MTRSPTTTFASHLGPFAHFCEAWTAGVRRVFECGADVWDGDVRIRELLNLSLVAGPCSAEDFVRAGAEPERVDLMIEKYRSMVPLPPYTMGYGALFKAHEGVDQIAWLVDKLRRKGETKAATIGFHVPGADELSCISLFDCKVRGGLLHVNAVYRSQNVYGSQPGNVVALADIQREIAGAVGVAIGPIALHALSAHIYHEDFERVAELLERRCRSGEAHPHPSERSGPRCGPDETA